MSQQGLEAFATATRKGLEGRALKATVAHAKRREDVRRIKGGVVGTDGKPVVAFRIDHGVRQWIDEFWPMFRSREIPAGVGIVTDVIGGNQVAPYEVTDPPVTWDELRASVNEGYEVWAHSRSHRDVQHTGLSLFQEIVESGDTLVANNLVPMGFHMPGIADVSVPDWSNNWNDYSSWDKEAGQLLLGRYGLIETTGAKRAMFRHGRGDGAYGNRHFTLDTMTLATATSTLNQAVEARCSTMWMFHPSLPLTMSNAELGTFLDTVKSLWDDGTIEVLTPSALAFSDPTTDYRADLIRDGQFQSGAFGSGRWTINTAGTGTHTVEATGGNGGRNFARLTPSGAGTAIQQDIGAMDAWHGMSGGTFMFEASVRVTTGDTGVRLQVRDASNPGIWIYIKVFEPISPGDTWHRIRVPFTHDPRSSNLRVVFGRYGGTGTGTLDIDNVSLKPV